MDWTNKFIRIFCMKSVTVIQIVTTIHWLYFCDSVKLIKFFFANKNSCWQKVTMNYVCRLCKCHQTYKSILLFIGYTIIQVFTKSYNNTTHKTLLYGTTHDMYKAWDHWCCIVLGLLAPKLGLCRESEKGLDLESAGLTYIYAWEMMHLHQSIIMVWDKPILTFFIFFPYNIQYIVRVWV